MTRTQSHYRRTQRRRDRRGGQTVAKRFRRPARSHILLLGLLFAIAFVWRLAYISRLAEAGLLGGVRADERVYWDWATYLLTHGFQGSNPFFFGPLYPYVLAAVRGIVGSDFGHVLVAQAVWGSAAAVLIADAARRIVGWPIGLAAGLFYALYRMTVFFDGLVCQRAPKIPQLRAWKIPHPGDQLTASVAA